MWGASRAEHTSFDAPPLSPSRHRSPSRSDACTGGSWQGGGSLPCAPGDARRVEDARAAAAMHHHERGDGPHEVPTTLL
jgi:hypothetical protein